MRRLAKDKAAAPAKLTARAGHVPDEAGRPLVAETDHFRVVDEHSYVLYRKGSHIRPLHAELDCVAAKQVDGAYQPA